MYVREVTRKNKTGSVTYLQLANSHWDPQLKRAVPEIVANLGRTDKDATGTLRSLAHSALKYLGETPTSGEPPAPEDSRPAGGAWILDGIWKQLGLDQAIVASKRLGPGRPKNMQRAERIIFAMVADRALAPSSKLAGVEWMTHDVAIVGMPDKVSEDECYRGMDWITGAEQLFERRVFDAVANLLNLEVDLIFFDTTSTYFETADEDTPIPRDGQGIACSDGDGVTRIGFRTWGKSKDSRPDLPQIIIGMAVTRTGIPVRVWCWPGNTSDSALIRQARAELREWSLSKVVYVADRGFTCEENRKQLMRAGDGYILGEKLRSGSVEAQEALSKPGRYKTVAGNLQVKEVTTSAQDRFIICFNPEQVPRDQATRSRLVARLHDMITASDELTTTQRAELKGKISTMPGLNRFLRVTPTGLLRIDQAKIRREAGLDGKYLLRTSDPHMTSQDVALGYKQLLEVERGWRDMKSVLELRPVYHRLEDRIRAHVTLCWLALLLIRVAETQTGQTWAVIRQQMQRLCQVTYQTPQGSVVTHTRTTPAQAAILDKLGLKAPARLTVAVAGD